jgi:hypothetical protein
MNCKDCGEPIPAERLREAPNSKVCVSCQTDREKQAKLAPRERKQEAEIVKKRGGHVLLDNILVPRRLLRTKGRK